jgi:asparaginyl-tRNA synthetase
VLRVRHEIIKQIRHYFDSHGFTLMDAPIFTPNAVEGTTTLFPVEYFDDKAYLTQSGQLYGEAGAMALGRIYTFGPTFRAEKSKTRRHLTEFWMVEPEVAFMDLAGDMDLAEDFLVSVVQGVLANRRAELEILERDISKLERVQKPFPRIRYEEAIEILQKKGKEAKFGDDFGADEETAISEQFDRPIMIHRYPAAIKSFYMNATPRTRAWRWRSTSSRPRATARSSAGRSARMIWRCSSRESPSMACRASRSSGTSISVATARCRTPASASASSARCSGSAACTTSARPSRFQD